MKTILLVGGLGMRLRPLTNNIAKPMIPLINKPFVEYTINLLKQHGLNEIIFSSYYLPEDIKSYFGNGSKFGVSIEYCLEESPLGTAGAVKHCESLLDNESFIIFNGDILTDLDMTAFVEFHKRKSAIATVSLGKVIDPTTYGMVDVADAGKVLRWYEKPSWSEATSRWVNIGACILEPQVLDYIPKNQKVSIERETFPYMINNGMPVFGYQSPAYWLDIGTPSKYLKAQRHILTGVIPITNPGNQVDKNLWIGENTYIDPKATVKGPVVIGSNSQILSGTIIIGPTVIGDNVQIDKEAFVEESTIWDECILDERASITNTILGKSAILKQDATLKEGCIVENKYIVHADRVYVNDTILSHSD